MAVGRRVQLRDSDGDGVIVYERDDSEELERPVAFEWLRPSNAFAWSSVDDLRAFAGELIALADVIEGA